MQHKCQRRQFGQLYKASGRDVRRWSAAGVTLLDTIMAVAVGSLMTVIAIPMTLNSMKGMRLTSAVSAATGAIQSTRYLAIMNGNSYQVTFTPSTYSYQVLYWNAGAGAFSNLNSAIPIAGPDQVTISRSITLQFSPNGTVTEIPTTGNMTFTITNAVGGSNTLSVSSVGYVSVTSP